METIIQIQHLQKHFGNLKVLNDVDFDIHKGEVVTIIGSSGSGKSTMLRCVNLLERMDGGHVLYHGKDILSGQMDVNEYRSKVGMVFQSFNLFNNLTVLENCMLGQIRFFRNLFCRRSEMMKLAKEVGSSENTAAAKAELEGAEGDLLRAKEENIRREGELKLASDKLSSVSSGVKELLEEKETLEKRIESVSSGAEAARSQIDELKETLENKEKELESITGDSKTLQKNREEVASKAAEIRLRIVSLQKDVEANTDEITRLKNRKTGHLDRLSELDGEIRGIEEKNDELRALTEQLSADEKALKENHGDAQNQINELISQRDELEKQANDLRLHERAKSEERERLSGDIARLEERKIAMRNEYDNLTSKLYDEYQLTRREAAALEIEIDDYSLAAKRLAELKSQIRALGSVNVSANGLPVAA